MPIGDSNTAEKRLLDLAAHGNKKDFGLLYEQYLDEIYRFVYISVRNRLEEETSWRMFL